MYGITETTVHTTHKGLTQNPAGKKDERLIGRALSDQEIYILDEYLNPVPIGIPGELYIGGTRLARGYLNNSQLTSERFIRHTLPSKPDSRLYKTGDLGRWHANGEIEYLGRIDFQVKLRGYRIEPGEIEAQLLTHPAIAQAIVVLRDDDPATPRLIAYWLKSASETTAATVGPEQLRSFLADRLPDYMVPSAFLQLEAFPLTPNGKLDRKALPAPSFSGNQAHRVNPCTHLEHQLHAIWAEVLGHGDFGVTDNFFSVGGHSLATARLVSRIEQALGTSLSLATLFQNPSIAGLVDLLAAKSSSDETSERGQAIPAATPIQIELP